MHDLYSQLPCDSETLKHAVELFMKNKLHLHNNYKESGGSQNVIISALYSPSLAPSPACKCLLGTASRGAQLVSASQP